MFFDTGFQGASWLQTPALASRCELLLLALFLVKFYLFTRMAVLSALTSDKTWLTGVSLRRPEEISGSPGAGDTLVAAALLEQPALLTAELPLQPHRKHL